MRELSGGSAGGADVSHNLVLVYSNGRSLSDSPGRKLGGATSLVVENDPLRNNKDSDTLKCSMSGCATRTRWMKHERGRRKLWLNKKNYTVLIVFLAIAIRSVKTVSTLAAIGSGSHSPAHRVAPFSPAPFISCCQFTTTMSFDGAVGSPLRKTNCLPFGKMSQPCPSPFLVVNVGEERVAFHDIQLPLRRKPRRHDVRGRAIIEDVTIGRPPRVGSAANRHRDARTWPRNRAQVYLRRPGFI